MNRHRWVVGALALCVAGVVTALGQGSLAAPSPAPAVQLDVRPPDGSRGSAVEGTLTKCHAYAATFSWVGSDEPWIVEDAGGGTWTATTTVPSDLDPGLHEVVAICEYVNAVTVSSSFLVTDKPALVLDPPAGPAGSPVKAVVSGVTCSADEIDAVTWEGNGQPWSEPVDEPDGSVSATTTVPTSFVPGASYDVITACNYIDGVNHLRATFTVTEDRDEPVPKLTLVPGEGTAGQEVTVTATGYQCDGAVELLWHGDIFAAVALDADGSLQARIPVPREFAPGEHDLLAECRADGFRWPLAFYLVTGGGGDDGGTDGDGETPRLVIEPALGPAGRQVTVTASGHQCAGGLVLRWRGEPVAGRTRTGNDGTARTRIDVPRDFALGSHDLLARCRADGFPWPPAHFEVTGGAEPPTLTLDPSRLRAGDQLTATATGYACAGDVVFLFDRERDAGRAASDSGGTATTVASVPADFTPGSHEVLATCEPDGHEWPLVAFTVVGDTAPTGSTWGRPPWLPLAFLVGILAVASLPWLSARHGVRWARLHVRAAPGEAARAGFQTTRNPQDRHTRDVTVRIRPHPDSGTQTFKEVDP